MHAEWKLFFHFLFFGAICTNTAVSYLFSNLLKPGKLLTRNLNTQSSSAIWRICIRVWLFYLIPTIGVVVFRVKINPSVGTVLMHIILILGVIILFKDSLFQKLSFYFILIGILSVTEFAAFFAMTVSVHMITGREVLLAQVNYMNHTLDMIIMNLFYILFCFLFIRYSTIVLLKFKSRIHFGHVTLLFTPGFFVSLGSGLILYQENSPQFLIRISAFILLDVFCVLLVFLNLRSIARRERKHELMVKQSTLVRQQLDYSNEIEEKYRVIRKQNHDIANQLQSLTWMLGSRHYQEASSYLDELIDCMK